MALVNDAEVAFGAGLTGLIVVHVSGVVPLVATGAGAEVAGIAQSCVAGFHEFAFGRACVPLAEGAPLKIRGVAFPHDLGDFQAPAIPRCLAAKKLIGGHWIERPFRAWVNWGRCVLGRCPRLGWIQPCSSALTAYRMRVGRCSIFSNKTIFCPQSNFAMERCKIGSMKRFFNCATGCGTIATDSRSMRGANKHASSWRGDSCAPKGQSTTARGSAPGPVCKKNPKP